MNPYQKRCKEKIKKHFDYVICTACSYIIIKGNEFRIHIPETIHEQNSYIKTKNEEISFSIADVCIADDDCRTIQ